jgi:HEAT repeat protein
MPLFGPPGPPDVAKLKAKRDIKGLINALGYEKGRVGLDAALALGEIVSRSYTHPDVSKVAVEALGRIHDARAISSLHTVARLADKNEVESAYSAFGYVGIAAIEPLIVDLAHMHEVFRRAAASALVQIGAPAVEPLVAALKDRNENARSAAAGALDRLAWSPGRGEVEATYCVAKREWDKCVEIGAVAVEPLISALGGKVIGDSMVRWRVAESLGRIGDARAVEPLVGALRDQDLGVRRAAASALGQIGTAAVEPLIAVLGDRIVGMYAASALGPIGDARAVEPLIGALKDPTFSGREAAEEALGKIGDSRAVEPLIAALEDPRSTVREAAGKALKALGWQPQGIETSAASWAAKGRAMGSKPTVVAFLVEGPSAAALGMFRQRVVIGASQSEWDEKIRAAAGCPDAEVRIIQPSEWNPPALSEVSQQELGNKYPLILSRMTDYVLTNGVPIPPDRLVNHGSVVFNPVSGKVFFAYRL